MRSFVFSSITNIESRLFFFIYSNPLLIYLEDKLTISPNREYSLLPPTVPQTPVKHVPVATPIPHLSPSFFNSARIVIQLQTQLSGSSRDEYGGIPHTMSITLPLSSIRNLLRAPLVRYIHLCTVLATLCTF